MGRQAILRRASALVIVLISAASIAAGCRDDGAPPGEEPIDREVFIEAYVELRLAALDAEDFIVSPAQREEILARHGVDEEMLLHFADVHGRDTDFMSQVWADVESRIEQRHSAEDSPA